MRACFLILGRSRHGVVLEVDQRIDIKDQADPTVAKNGGTGQKRIGLESFAKIFDHDFLFPNEFIDESVLEEVLKAR